MFLVEFYEINWIFTSPQIFFYNNTNNKFLRNPYLPLVSTDLLFGQVMIKIFLLFLQSISKQTSLSTQIVGNQSKTAQTFFWKNLILWTFSSKNRNYWFDIKLFVTYCNIDMTFVLLSSAKEKKISFTLLCSLKTNITN